MDNGATPGDAFVEAVAQRTSELVLAGLQPQQADRQEWFTVAQAAARYGVSEDTIRNAIKNGKLRRHTRGERSISLHADDLDRYFGATR